MMRIFSVLFLVAGLVAWEVRAGDDPGSGTTEPPVRLKKKERKAVPPPPEKTPENRPEEKKPKEKTERPEDIDKGGEDADPASMEEQPEAREILARVSKNMKAAEERLARKETAEGTRQIQKDILKDIDSLIEQGKRQQQLPANQDQQQADDQKDPSQQKKTATGKQQQDQSRPRPNRSRQQRAQNKPKPSEKQTPSDMPRPGAGDKGDKREMSKIADLYKDIWGHLPETLRMEMNQYSREQFMPKYSDLLKQYYSTIAEKGRRNP